MTAILLLLACTSSADTEIEQWATTDGFSVEAAFVESEDGQVTLRRPDGEEMQVPLEELDRASRERAEQYAAAGEDDGFRQWTSSSGMSLRARYEKLDGNILILLSEDETVVKIPLHRLSDDDRKLALEMAGREDEIPKIETGPNKLPQFTSGIWQGWHAVYQHSLFDALMNADGRVMIYLKDGNKRLEPPLSLYLAPYYRDYRSRSRRIKEFKDPPEPVMQPEEITLEGLLVEDVPFTVNFEFDGNTITAWGWCEDHDDVSPPTHYRILLRVPQTHNIPPHVPQEERIKMLQGFELTMREITGSGRQTTTYNYYDAIRFRHSVREATIVTPQWKPRTVNVRPGSSRFPLRPWIYADRSLWQGYVLQMIKPEQDSRSRSRRIEVTIE